MNADHTDGSQALRRASTPECHSVRSALSQIPKSRPKNEGSRKLTLGEEHLGLQGYLGNLHGNYGVVGIH